MWRILGDAMGSDATRRLPRIEHRTLVVRGDRDVVVSAEWARAVADLLPAGRLVTPWRPARAALQRSRRPGPGRTPLARPPATALTSWCPR